MTACAGCRGRAAEEGAAGGAGGPRDEAVLGGADEDIDAALREEDLEGEAAPEAAEESRHDPGASAPAEGGMKNVYKGFDRLPGHSGGLDAPVKSLTRRKQKLKEHCTRKKMKARGISIPGAHLRIIHLMQWG